MTQNDEELKSHTKIAHGAKNSIEQSSQDKIKSDVVNVESEEFKIVSYPEDDPEPQGFTIKGKSKPYLKAHGTLKLMMKKGQVYHIGGRKVNIKDVDTKFKGGINVETEVTAKNGKSGKAKLTIYNKGKKPTATIQVSKKDDDFKFRKILTLKILKPLLEGLISGAVTRKTIAEYRKNPVELNSGTQCNDKQGKYFVCDQCGKKFSLARTLKSHVTKMHKKTVNNIGEEKADKKCPKCDLMCDKIGDLDTHMEDHENIEILQKQKEFDMINKGGSVTKYYMCETCQRAFSTNASYSVHIESHHKSKNYNKKSPEDALIKEKIQTMACDECEMVFKNQLNWKNINNLTKHKRNKHAKNTESDMKINCDYCNFTSKGLYDLKRHFRDVHQQVSGSTSPPPKKHRESLVKKNCKYEPYCERCDKDCSG